MNKFNKWFNTNKNDIAFWSSIWSSIITTIVCSIIILSLSSCSEFVESDVIKSEGVITTQTYVPSKEKTGYHWGYSLMRGEFCTHWGTYTESAKYETEYSFNNRIFKNNSPLFYKYVKSNDTITIYYTLKYEVKDKDSIFNGYSIKRIITPDTTFVYD